MGISIGHNWSCSSYDKPKAPEPTYSYKKLTLPNPKPENFKILNHWWNGHYLIVLIHYPDCTNYEGRKILLFEGVCLEDLIEQGSIDPHFSESKEKHSPIARFEPTLRGWDMAQKLVDSLIKRA